MANSSTVGRGVSMTASRPRIWVGFHAEGLEEGNVLGSFGPTGEVPHMLKKLQMAGTNIVESMFAKR